MRRGRRQHLVDLAQRLGEALSPFHHLLDQLPMQRFQMGLARVDTAPGKGPDRPSGELEAHQQDVLVGRDEERTNSLADAQLVVDHQEGTRRVYRVDPAGLAPLRAYLERFWQQAMVAFAQHAENQHADNQTDKE